MSDFRLTECMMQLRVEEAHRQAELRRLQKTARADRTSWLARQRYRALRGLGSFLVSSGRHLLQSISPSPPSAEAASRGA